MMTDNPKPLTPNIESSSMNNGSNEPIYVI